MPNQNYTPGAAIPASEYPKPSQVPQPSVSDAIDGKAYTPEAGDAGGWEKFTRTRPFNKCLDCGQDLAPSQGMICPVCERMKHSQVSRIPHGPPLPDDVMQDR